MKFSIQRFAFLVLIYGASLLGGCSLLAPEPVKKAPTTKKAPPVKKEDKIAVKITPKMAKAVVTHNGKKVTIERIQDHENRVNENFVKTSRICPPFCIQPASLGHGVNTIGELEVIDYTVKQSNGDKSIILVDARSPEWLKLGTIPGSTNIPYSRLNRAKGAVNGAIEKAMKQLGVTKRGNRWNFKHAKTVVLFSNGMWSDQSSSAVEGLLKEGYPAKKIKWYRGGLQSWEILGLTVVKPKPKEEEF
jgi:rhodanese-related sulfurtransferase